MILNYSIYVSEDKRYYIEYYNTDYYKLVVSKTIIGLKLKVLLFSKYLRIKQRLTIIKEINILKK